MRFDSMLPYLRAGLPIRRAAWGSTILYDEAGWRLEDDTCLSYYLDKGDVDKKEKFCLWAEGAGICSAMDYDYTLSVTDLMATDWEIVPQSMDFWKRFYEPKLLRGHWVSYSDNNRVCIGIPKEHILQEESGDTAE